MTSGALLTRNNTKGAEGSSRKRPFVLECFPVLWDDWKPFSPTIQLQLIWLLFTFFFLLLSSKRMTVNEISSNYSSVWNLTQILDQFTWWNMSEICPAAEAPTIAGSLQSVNCSIYTALVSKREKPVMWWAKWVQLVNLHSRGCWWLHKLCVRPGGSVIQRASQQQNLLKNCVKTKKISIWSTLWDVLEKQLCKSHLATEAALNTQLLSEEDMTHLMNVFTDCSRLCSLIVTEH